MAIAIRLRRMGRKKQPFYRVVIADKANPPLGKFVDDLGYYDPMKDPAEVVINEQKALMWLERGAKPTESTRSLLSKQGILKKFHELQNQPKPEQPQEEETKQEEEETQTGEQSDNEQEETP